MRVDRCKTFQQTIQMASNDHHYNLRQHTTTTSPSKPPTTPPKDPSSPSLSSSSSSSSLSYHSHKVKSPEGGTIIEHHTHQSSPNPQFSSPEHKRTRLLQEQGDETDNDNNNNNNNENNQLISSLSETEFDFLKEIVSSRLPKGETGFSVDNTIVLQTCYL